MKPHGFHREADAEYVAAAEYYAGISPELGSRFFDEIERLIADACANPTIFVSLPTGAIAAGNGASTTLRSIIGLIPEGPAAHGGRGVLVELRSRCAGGTDPGARPVGSGAFNVQSKVVTNTTRRDPIKNPLTDLKKTPAKCRPARKRELKRRRPGLHCPHATYTRSDRRGSGAMAR